MKGKRLPSVRKSYKGKGQNKLPWPFSVGVRFGSRRAVDMGSTEVEHQLLERAELFRLSGGKTRWGGQYCARH